MNFKYLVQRLSSKEIDGVKCEPFERVQIDTPEEYQGSVIQSLSERKGEMLDMISTGKWSNSFGLPCSSAWFDWILN